MKTPEFIEIIPLFLLLPAKSLFRGKCQTLLTTGSGGSLSLVGLPPAQYTNRGRRNAIADEVTSLQANYNDSEDIFAGYVEGDITFGRLNILGGFRIEATQAVYGAFAHSPATDPGNPASYRFVHRNSNYSNVFPDFQALYKINDTLQARFSYSTAIGRPTFGQITPSTIVNSVDRTITTGNPGLRPTTDNSFDLALDYYPVKSAYFSIGLFDKQIANYIFQRSVIVPLEGTFYTESTFLNGGSGYSRGIELNYQQQFVDLPGPLSGLGIAANYTYTDSNGSIHPGYLLLCLIRHGTFAMRAYSMPATNLNFL